jgi:predicted CoA-binding protein
MSTREQIEDLLSQSNLALIGASRQGRRFGNAILKELTAKGYKIFPGHQHRIQEMEQQILSP